MPLFKRKTENALKITSSLWKSDSTSVETRVPNGTVYCDSSHSSPVPYEETPRTLLSEAEENFNPGSPMRTKSRLSKTLHEVLNDHGALAYFIQFMEAQRAKHLIKFWLEAESFLVSAKTRLKGKLDKQCALTEKDLCLELPPGKRNEFNTAETDVFLPIKPDGKKSSKSCIELVNDTDSQKSPEKQDERLLLNNTKSKSSLLLQDEWTTQSETNHSCESESLRPSVVYVNNENSFSCDVYTNKSNKEDNSSSIVNNVNNKNVSQLSDITVLPETEQKELLYDSVEEHLDKLIMQKGIDQYESSKDAIVDQNDVRNITRSIEQDAINIYSKYIAQNAPYPIGVSDELRNQTYANINQESAGIDPNSFVPVQKFIVEKMDIEYFPSFLRSTFHCKHQIDVLTSGTVYLADILYNDSALFYFMEYTEQEGVRHLVDFLLITDNFHNQFSTGDRQHNGMEAQDDAMILYDKYFSLQATNSLGFSKKIRREIEQNICQTEGPSADCFLKPVTILMQHLEKTYLPQFLTSQLYFKYLSECINTIQNGCDILIPRRRSGSESSSEHSIPVQQQTINTLLAMDSKQPGVAARKILKNIEDQDMRIDTGQFHPDALWKRQLAGKLQMAYVNKFGKLSTEFQPEPDRKTGSRLSKAVKKLVNWEEDKTQEDMAWQIAEMIVKDICDITMGQNITNKKNHNEESGVS